jgi:hypothetical protein
MKIRDLAVAFAVAAVLVLGGVHVAEAAPVHARPGCHAALIGWFDAGHGDTGHAFRRFERAHCGADTAQLRAWVAWWLGRASS